MTIDRKNRIVLDKESCAKSGFKKGAKLIAIPFKGGITLVEVSNKTYVGSLDGFSFVESEHEASKFLFRRKGEKN